MKNPILPYAWGSYSAIGTLLDLPVPTNEPQAELWMGAHPKAPSQVFWQGAWHPLTELLEKKAKEIIGERGYKIYGLMPYLFKILAAKEPLSIQAHPDKAQAKAGYARENMSNIPLSAKHRNYKDDNHKPEIICALTHFWGLKGFRDYGEILHLVDSLECPALQPELETFRQAQKGVAEKQEVRLTFMPFLMKAVAGAMRAMPVFNAALAADGESLIYRHYVHIGIAVDTPNGLVVPVVRDVDRKGLFELARELMTLSAKAREGKLTPGDMQGGCFSISSLGGIGGTAFTPIVNAPEVAILGVSRSQMKPVWDGAAFQPRLMLPLSLSYDHRVVDGADGARFTTLLGDLLGDIRRLLL